MQNNSKGIPMNTLINADNEYTDMYWSFKNKQITPSSIVGTGYRYPRAVAGGWLIKQILKENGHTYCDIRVNNSGVPFTSVEQAKRTHAYKLLEQDRYLGAESIFKVVEFTVCKSPIDKGFIIAIKTQRKSKGA